MSPVDDMRRHCAACETVVTDFRNMSDDELVSFLSKPQGKICGRFHKTQLDRPLQALPEISRPARWWKSLALLPLVLFPKQARAQQDTVSSFTQEELSAANIHEKTELAQQTAVDSSLAQNDTNKIRVVLQPVDSANKWIFAPIYGEVSPYGLYPGFSGYYLPTGGAAIITTVDVSPVTIMWQMPPEECIYVTGVFVPSPSPVSKAPEWNTITVTLGFINIPQEPEEKQKLVQYSFWKDLFGRIDVLLYYGRWRRTNTEAVDNLVEVPASTKEKSEKEEQVPAGTRSADYSTAVLPDNRNKSRRA